MAYLYFSEGQERPPQAAEARDQLLPNVVDGMAQTRPEALYAMIPRSFTSYENGYRKITYRKLANAVNTIAWRLTDELGSGSGSEALAYVGPNDIGYAVMVFGAAKAGYSALNCTKLLTLPPPYSDTVKTVLAGTKPEPRIIHVPDIYTLVDGDSPHFPYARTYANAKDETLFSVGTSGTTNRPKPVTYTHATIASYLRGIKEPAPDGYENYASFFESTRMFLAFPSFHIAGLVVIVISAPTSQTTVVSLLGGVPPSADGIIEAMKHVDIDVLHMPAPFLEQIGANPEQVDFVTSRVSLVGYSGSDVSQATGDAFASKVNMINFHGSTEALSYPSIRPRTFPVGDWKYFQPHPSANFDFQPSGISDFCEAVIIKHPDPERIQPVFFHESSSEYRTHDLWSPHPQRANTWMYRGRADDIIVSATGENYNPISMEMKMSKLPEVAAVLIAGSKRYQKLLLVEPTDKSWSESPERRQEFIDLLWPSVENANASVVEYSRIARTHILLTSSDLPLRRTSKGSVQRGPSLELYKHRIDELYEAAGDGVGGNKQPFVIAAGDSTEHVKNVK